MSFSIISQTYLIHIRCYLPSENIWGGGWVGGGCNADVTSREPSTETPAPALAALNPPSHLRRCSAEISSHLVVTTPPSSHRGRGGCCCCTLTPAFYSCPLVAEWEGRGYLQFMVEVKSCPWDSGELYGSGCSADRCHSRRRAPPTLPATSPTPSDAVEAEWPIQANTDKSRCLNGGLCLVGQLHIFPRRPTGLALIEVSHSIDSF